MTLLVVAVALLREDGAVLLQRRRQDRAHGGLWEFPGGKVEADEGLRDAACRELREELGVSLAPANLAEVGFAAGRGTDGGEIAILLFSAHRWGGSPVCLDGEAMGWFAPNDIAALAMPPLDYPLAAALKRWLTEQTGAKAK